MMRRPPELAIRPQIQDMVTDNIAVLAEAARHLDGVIPLWFGEGDVAAPCFIRDAVTRALDAGQVFYVPDMRGVPALTSALAAYQSRLHGRPIGQDRTAVTPGGMQAVALACSLVLEAGTNAVYLTPQWPNIAAAIHVTGAEGRPCPLEMRDGAWTLDLAAVEARCDARTRAIVFSSPANPTGWTATAAELQGLLELARRRGLWLIADSVYERLYFDGGVAPGLLAMADPEDLLLSVNSFSKAWGMTGFRLGWLTHPAALCARVGALTQYLNSGTAAFVQAAGTAAVTEGEGLVAEIRARAKAGVDLAYARLGEAGRVRLGRRPAGGMYVFFQVDGWADARAGCLALLEQTRVGLAPGELFGEAGAGWFRMCVCREPGGLAVALDRLAEALR